MVCVEMHWSIKPARGVGVAKGVFAEMASVLSGRRKKTVQKNYRLDRMLLLFGDPLRSPITSDDFRPEKRQLTTV